MPLVPVAAVKSISIAVGDNGLPPLPNAPRLLQLSPDYRFIRVWTSDSGEKGLACVGVSF